MLNRYRTLKSAEPGESSDGVTIMLAHVQHISQLGEALQAGSAPIVASETSAKQLYSLLSRER